MSDVINFDAQDLIQSSSPTAPFSVIYQSDVELCVVYALISSGADLGIVDQVVLDGHLDHSDVVVRWNPSGTRAALLIDERIIVVFDFKENTTYSNQLVPSLPTTWLRQAFEFSSALAVEFGVDEFFKQPELDQAIDASKSRRLKPIDYCFIKPC